MPAACLRAPLPSGTGDGDEIDVPRQTVLHQNIPNPFNPFTTIEFDLAQAGHVTLGIFDVAGRRVQTLIDAQMKAGRGYRVVWNGHDAAGRLVPSGMYLYRLMAPDRTEVRKMVVLR